MKIVFMGTPDFSVTVLEKIYKAGHEIGYVFTQPDKAKNRGKKIQFPPVKEKALELNMEVLQPNRIKNNEEVMDILKKYQPDIIVVVAYGQILPKEVLELPKYGAVNVHASLLPKLRGASPIQQAIVQGEEKTGVTIMQMSEGLDTGDMLTKVDTFINKKTYVELQAELAVLGGNLLVDTLTLIENGKVKREVQDDNLSTYAGMIAKEDGKINFSKSPIEIERLIRGFDPWPGAFCKLDETVLKIWKAIEIDENTSSENGTILKADKEGIKIACGGKILNVLELQMPGKKRISVDDFLRGHKIEIGTVLQ